MTGRHVAIYARLSPRPDGKLEGVDVQERYGRAYARQTWPGVPVVVYREEKLITGGDPDVWRPAYEKLRDALADGEVAHLWTVEQSRLTRDEREWFTLAAELVAADITEVHTRRDGIVRVDDDVAGIKAVLNAGELRKMRKRVNDRLADNAARGWAPGSRPFGYAHAVADDGAKTYVIVPEQAAAIREAARLVLSGWSLARVAKQMREQGVRGAHAWRDEDRKGRRGTVTATTIRGWLTKPTVAGLRVHKGVVVGRGNWEPILDEATWQALRAKLSAPRVVERADGRTYPVGTAHRGGTGRKYLLTGGLIECGVCGAPMVGTVKQLKGGAAHGGRDVAYYLCHPSKGGRACTGIMLEPTDEHVLGLLFAELDKPEFLDALAADKHEARRGEIVTELFAIDARRHDLAGMWAAGELDTGEWKAAKAGLDEREGALRGELADKGPPPARASLEQARSAWPLMKLDEKREFIRLFVSRVVIAPAAHRGGGRPGFDTGRITVEWATR